MSERVRWSSAWVVGLLVAAALALGVKETLAKPVQLTCPDNGYDLLGSCTSQANCQSKCDAVHGLGNSFGQCHNGCCRCLF